MEMIADSAELPGVGLDIRWAPGSGFADPLDGLAVVGSMSVLCFSYIDNRSVDLRAQPEHSNGHGVGHWPLHAADRQPLSRRVGLRQ